MDKMRKKTVPVTGHIRFVGRKPVKVKKFKRSRRKKSRKIKRRKAVKMKWIMYQDENGQIVSKRIVTKIR